MIALDYAGERAEVYADGSILYFNEQPGGYGRNHFPLPFLVRMVTLVRDSAYPLAPCQQWTAEEILRREG